MAMQTPAPGEEDKRWPTRFRTTCSSCHRVNLAGSKLWLSTETRHGLFYAYNFDHLDHIEAYVRATLRKVAFEPGGIRNQAVTSRLPPWVKSAKNRAEVLKTIDRMRRR